MTSSRRKSESEQELTGGGDSSMFGITLKQLTELSELRKQDLLKKLNSPDFNGVKGILEKLKVDPSKGLDSNNTQDLEQRQIAYGKNRLPHLIEPWPLDFIFAHKTWKREREMQKAIEKREDEEQATVIRDNRPQQIRVIDVVVGDICPFKTGDLLPADGLLLESTGLKMDESPYTGETDLINKSEEEEVCLLSGTKVMEGSGIMVVVAVGPNTETGRIFKLLRESKPSSN